MNGFHGAGVLEVVEDHDGDTYRAVYTVKFKRVLYVLHVFQKKSVKGSKTPKHEIDLIKARLVLAMAAYAEWVSLNPEVQHGEEE
jgi:phage-related protein